MSQRRINVYGDLIDTADMPDMISNIMAPGRIIGCNFTVAGSDLMYVTPGSCLLPDGVLVLEDEAKSLIVPNSSLPADYTIVYQLEDTIILGGSPAILRLLTGIKRQQDFPDGVILGWLRYPGGSIPISPEFFIQPSHLRIEKRSDTFTYINQCPLSVIKQESGFWHESHVDVESEYCTKYTNTSDSLASYVVKFPFVIPGIGQPRKLVCRLLADFNAIATFSLKLHDIDINLSSGSISNTGGLITREISVPYVVWLEWTAGHTAQIIVNIDAYPGKGVSIAYIGLTSEPTPFNLFL